MTEVYKIIEKPIDTKQLRKTFAAVDKQGCAAVLKNQNRMLGQAPECIIVRLDANGFHFMDLRLRITKMLLLDKIRSIAYQESNSNDTEILSKDDVRDFKMDLDDYVLHLDDVLIKEAFLSERLFITFDSEETVNNLQKGDIYIEWTPSEVSDAATEKFIQLFYPRSVEKARQHVTQFDLRFALYSMPTFTKISNGSYMIGASGMKHFGDLRNMEEQIFDSANPSTRKTKFIRDENRVCVCIYAKENELMEICRNVPFRIGIVDDFVVLTDPPCKDIFVEKSHIDEVEAYLHSCNVHSFYLKDTTVQEIEKTLQEYEQDVANELKRAEFNYACYMFYRDGGEKTENIIFKSTGTNEPPMPFTKFQ